MKEAKEKYKVQMEFMYGWDDVWYSDDNEKVPTLFDSKEEAEEEIKIHLEMIKEAIEEGNMDEESIQTREEFRIININQ